MGGAVSAISGVESVTTGIVWSAGTRPPRPVTGFDFDADEAEEIEEEIVTLAAHIHAANHRLLVLLARYDRLGAWELAGHRSCAHWLAFSTGFDLGTAREHVRVARALEALPLTGATMARGELSFSQVRALTRVADAHSESALLELAEGCTTAQLEVSVRAWKKGTRQDEAERERELHRSRAFSVFPGDDGMYIVRGRLTPEVGAVLMRALEAAAGALYRESRTPDRAVTDHEPSASMGMGAETGREGARRRADAVGLLAERALGAAFGSDVAPVSGARAERFMVTVLADEATLRGDQATLRADKPAPAAERHPGRSRLEDGTRVSPETSRRLSCDCGVVRMTRGRDGSILDVGRKTRSIPPALRRALEVRDGGCRFPGCNARFTDGHHVTHWADGGPTSLANASCCAAYTTAWCTRMAGGWSGGATAAPRSAIHAARCTSTADGGRPPCRSDRWTRWCTGTGPGRETRPPEDRCALEAGGGHPGRGAAGRHGGRGVGQGDRCPHQPTTPLAAPLTWPDLGEARQLT